MVAAPDPSGRAPGTQVICGDLGGTSARLWLAGVRAGTVAVQLERVYPVAECAGPDDLFERFAQACREHGRALGRAAGVRRACIGVAGPVDAARARLTNSGWVLDARRIAERWAIDQVLLVNDFEAAANGIAALEASQLYCLQAGTPHPQAPRLVIGAGTGLGVAYVIGPPGAPQVIPGEAGHAGFAPADALQAELWQYLHRRHGRVHAELVVSGAGLVRLWEFLVATGRASSQPRSNAEIRSGGAAAVARLALEEQDPGCRAAVDLFARAFGAVAGDHALAVLARGGVYLAGGMAPKLLPALAEGGFIAAFRDKPPFNALAEQFPVHLVRDERLGLLGAALLATRTPA
ncbi:MAG: glucokinase [Burkholderiales bacterium]|nr:MAG: glucokinase [Burkholderiales bacterium]